MTIHNNDAGALRHLASICTKLASKYEAERRALNKEWRSPHNIAKHAQLVAQVVLTIDLKTELEALLKASTDANQD